MASARDRARTHAGRGELNNQIDLLTEKFRESDATFYNEYQTSRSIVTNATSRKGKDATVTPVVVAKAA